MFLYDESMGVFLSNGSPGHTVWHDGSFHDRSQQPRASLEAQSLETTADGVNEAETCGLERDVRSDLIIVYIVCDILEDLVWFRPNSRLSVVDRHGACGCQVQSETRGTAT